MSTSTANRDTLISQHIRAAKKILQEAAFDTRIATTLNYAELDALQQDAFEVVRLIRFRRNAIAPVNRIPPEIIALVPDHLDGYYKDRNVIALSQVCRAWREALVSRPSLWTNLNCVDANKTLVYLERSASSPINLSVSRARYLHPLDPFLGIIPRVIGRLKSLTMSGSQEGLRAVIACLFPPTPLLEDLSIRGEFGVAPHRHPVLTSAHFGGDLSSLRKLCLECIRTELPWRNMDNLMSFKLLYTSPVSVRQLLDFFESAPHLREVDLLSTTSTFGVQDRRLVSLACLKWMVIAGDSPSSILLDHLLIPAGASLMTRVGSQIRNHIPRSLNNLRNLFGFTTIELDAGLPKPYIRFSGPNGEFSMILEDPQVDTTSLLLESLTHFDTSGTERLEIASIDPPISNAIYRMLLPMNDLRALTLTQFERPLVLVHALDPSMGPSGIVLCPKLEELVFEYCAGNESDIQSVTEMAAARALRGARLGTVWR